MVDIPCDKCLHRAAKANDKVKLCAECTGLIHRFSALVTILNELCERGTSRFKYDENDKYIEFELRNFNLKVYKKEHSTERIGDIEIKWLS
jgi:hypothetical protein